MDLILTLDYELYGDGSGDVFETMIDPTNNFLALCKRHGIKSTIFFEIMEYLKIKEEWNKGNKMNYTANPAEAISDQIIEAYKAGHDIQLHIHPHWINAKYEDNRWLPDSRYWKLTNVPLTGDENFPLGLEELLKLGKESIEAILKPIDPDYKCNIFRAGGYCMTPSDKVVASLINLGFIADSSVIPGAYLNNEFYFYDFQHISSEMPFWWINESVDLPVKTRTDFVEIPVFAKKMRRYKKYDLQRIKIALKNKGSNLTKIKDKVEDRKSLAAKFNFFLQEESLTWDFCLFSSKKMNNYLKLARKISAQSSSGFHPFVLIGHSKEFLLPQVFEDFIIKNKKELNYLTLKSAVERINKDT